MIKPFYIVILKRKRRVPDPIDKKKGKLPTLMMEKVDTVAVMVLETKSLISMRSNSESETH